MIENFLRQNTKVEIRIVSISLILLLFFFVSIPLILQNNAALSDQLQEINDVEEKTDRLLLKASASVSASRANLIHYLHGFLHDVDSPFEDAGQAIQYLDEIKGLAIDSERETVIEGLTADLARYQGLINELAAARNSESGQNIELEAQALQLASDTAVKIDQLAQQSELNIAVKYENTFNESSRRLTNAFVIYFVLLVVVVLLIRSIRQSIVKPIAELQEGADQFRKGKWETTIPVSGNDELTLLAATFNQMATDLAESQLFLERRVAQRTQSLETIGEISNNLSSILDKDAFSIAVVEQLKLTFGYYYVQLYLADDINEVFTLKSATGMAGQRMLIRGHRLKKGQGLVGQAALSQDVVVASDVTKNPHWLNNPLLPDTKSEVAVPIISRSAVLGVLDIQHNVVNGISNDEVALLKAISDQVAIALENSRLFEKIQQQATYEAVLNRVTQKIQLASSVDQVLQITAQELGQVLNAEFTSVHLGKSSHPTNGYDKEKVG